MKFDEKIQLIIVGESCVGKTTLLYKYTQGIFTNQHLATVGLEYFTKEEKVRDKIIRVKIWDTAGQEQYKALTKNFYRNSDGVIIIYDVSNKSTFEKVQEWIQSITDSIDSEKVIQRILVGNKIDLPRQVTTEEGKKLAEMYNLPFFESSAKDNSGVNDFMKRIIEDAVGSLSVKRGIELDETKLNTNEQAKGGCGC